MIKDLMYKELRLNVNPWMYTWLAMALLLFIPSWVFFFAIGYIFMFFMLLGQQDKANQDLAFAMSLPIPKSGIVTARTYTIIIVEIAALLVAAPVAILRYWIYPFNNAAGMNTNLAFFGFMLMMYAVFNIIFLPGSYKRAYRLLWPILGGSVISVLFAGTVTSLVAILPSLAFLNDRGLGNLGAQMIVFLIGLGTYAVLTWLAHRQAVANFAEVDL